MGFSLLFTSIPIISENKHALGSARGIGLSCRGCGTCSVELSHLATSTKEEQEAPRSPRPRVMLILVIISVMLILLIYTSLVKLNKSFTHIWSN